MAKKTTQELLVELDDRIDSVKESEEFKEILKFYSRFHNYSYRNTLLIQMQKPDATYVAGFNQWKNKFDRHVKEGEEGIAILAPFTYTKTITEIKEIEKGDVIVEKEVEKEIVKTYFKPVYVFDVSQTKGKPLPQLDISIEDEYSKLLQPLIEFSKDRGVNVQFKNLSAQLKGYYQDNKIVIDEKASITGQASILVHELGHFLLHHETDREDNKKITKEIKEMEAEAVAFVVMNHFDIEIKSDKYLALYKESYNLKESLEYINTISSEIIDHCNEELKYI